jgi:hypothetical protein
MKIFSIFFASVLATISLSTAAPSFANGKSHTVKPATVEQNYQDKDSDDSYEEEAGDGYEKEEVATDHPDVPDVKDDNSPDEYEMTKKGRKYKTDKYDHPNHTNKAMCGESELDHNGGKTGWHNDKYDPTHYDDKDDVDHCGYYFPHETAEPVHYENDANDDGKDDTTGEKCTKKRDH